METTNDKPADAVETPFALEIQDDAEVEEEVDNRTQEEIDRDNRMFAIELAEDGAEAVSLMEPGDSIDLDCGSGIHCFDNGYGKEYSAWINNNPWDCPIITAEQAAKMIDDFA